jgi:two-component system chemotaxis sensor kinase CheA
MLHLIAQIEKTRDRIEVKNRELDGLLNALGQGFISFGPDGKCSPVYSAACREIFEMDPAAQSVLSLLRIPQDKHPILETKIKEAFAQRNFDLLFKVLPREFTNSMGRYITFEYRVGQLDASGNVLHAIIVATDRTAQMKAEKAVELERRHSMMIATIVKQKRFFRLFLSDLRAGLEKFVGHSVQPENEEQVSLEFKRFLHSIKGGFGMFWMEDHAKAVHEMEAEWKAQALSGDGMRIQRQAVRIQSLINGFIEKNMDVLGNEFRTDRVIEIPLGSWIPVLSQAETDGSVALQKTLFEMTLLPIGRFFEPFSELSIKIARSQRKKLLPLEFRGADLMLYPEPYATLFTTCVHLFRNAVDHGLETPEEREAAGKNAAGRIRVSFSEEQSEGRTWICVRVSDDGRGIDPERIRRARNLPADLPVNQVLDTVFAPGFTTRETVTEISGRGEGLFATREAARELGGEITVTSKLGEGSEFVLRVPRLAVQTSAPKSVQQGLKRGA